MTWVCPLCGYTTTQPDRVKQVAHCCPKRRHKDEVELQPEDGDS